MDRADAALGRRDRAPHVHDEQVHSDPLYCNLCRGFPVF